MLVNPCTIIDNTPKTWMLPSLYTALHQFGAQLLECGKQLIQFAIVGTVSIFYLLLYAANLLVKLVRYFLHFRLHPQFKVSRLLAFVRCSFRHMCSLCFRQCEVLESAIIPLCYCLG